MPVLLNYTRTSTVERRSLPALIGNIWGIALPTGTRPPPDQGARQTVRPGKLGRNMLRPYKGGPSVRWRWLHVDFDGGGEAEFAGVDGGF